MKVNRIAECLNGIIWHYKHLRQGTKEILYKSVKRHIITYSVEIRHETVKRGQQDEGVNEKDIERGTIILMACRVNSIEDCTGGRRIEWN